MFPHQPQPPARLKATTKATCVEVRGAGHPLRALQHRRTLVAGNPPAIAGGEDATWGPAQQTGPVRRRVTLGAVHVGSSRALRAWGTLYRGGDIFVLGLFRREKFRGRGGGMPPPLEFPKLSTASHTPESASPCSVQGH